MTSTRAIEVRGQAQYDAWQARVLPPVERVRPGLWSVPVPIPDNPLRYVSMYVLEQRDGVAVVDAGWPTPEAWDALASGLAQTGHAVADVRAVLVTHAHADHYGLAPRIRAESGAWIGLHEADAAMLTPHEPESFVSRMTSWLQDRGADDAEATEVMGEVADYHRFFTLEPPDRFIADRERPLEPDWDLTAIWTPGHTPGHLCFHLPGDRLLLSGDHVLPRISPTIGAMGRNDDDPGDNPLDVFMASLRMTAGLECDEVLPAHEYRFAPLDRRVDQLLLHHEHRLAEIEGLVREHPGTSTWTVAERTAWARPWSETLGLIRRTAVAETYAHLLSLEASGRIARDRGRVDRWQPVARPASAVAG